MKTKQNKRTKRTCIQEQKKQKQTNKHNTERYCFNQQQNKKEHVFTQRVPKKGNQAQQTKIILSEATETRNTGNDKTQNKQSKQTKTNKTQTFCFKTQPKQQKDNNANNNKKTLLKQKNNKVKKKPKTRTKATHDQTCVIKTKHKIREHAPPPQKTACNKNILKHVSKTNEKKNKRHITKQTKQKSGTSCSKHPNIKINIGSTHEKLLKSTTDGQRKLKNETNQN